MKKWNHSDIEILKSNLHLTNKSLMTLLSNKSISDIKYKCKILGLKKRSKFCKFTPNEIRAFQNNQEFNDRIIGHLLGDGSLNSNISFSLRNTHKDYVKELQLFFNSITGRKNKIVITPSYIRSFNEYKSQCKESYTTTFTCSVIVKSLKQKWYNNSIKIVPQDIILSPLVCNRWYCDDGNLYIDKQRGIFRITLYTDSFSINDINFLLSSLTHLVKIHPKKKIRKNRNNDQYVITISGKDALLFLSYIKKYPVNSFAYKWDIKPYEKHNTKCCHCGQLFDYSGFVRYRKLCNCCK